MALLSLPQLLILFDHLLLAVLFLVALFCIVAAVTSNMQVVMIAIISSAIIICYMLMKQLAEIQMSQLVKI